MTTPTLPLAIAAGVTAALLYRRHLNRQALTEARRPKLHPRWQDTPMPTAAEMLAEYHAEQEATR